MIFEELPLKGAYVIRLDKHEDNRGYFARQYCRAEFEKHGLDPNIAQTNISHSVEKYTLRGFHYQYGDCAEAKTIQCLQGQILDVIIDLRSDSATQYSHFQKVLSANSRESLHVPKGFAHAFLTLTPNAVVHYLVSRPYTPTAERGIRWNDPFFAIDWPTASPVVSKKDSSWVDY